MSLFASFQSAPVGKSKDEPKFKRGTQDLSASVKNVGVDGVEGLNLKWEAPFKFDEWVVGFKLALSDLRRAPETLFVKRTYDTPIVDGAATVDCSYNVASKVLSTDCTWVSKTSDLEVSLSGNTEDRLTKVGVAGSVRIAGEKLALEATQDLKHSKYTGSARVAHGDTSITVSYDSEENDPLLKVNHKLDNLNSVTPKISLKSGAASCKSKVSLWHSFYFSFLTFASLPHLTRRLDPCPQRWICGNGVLPGRRRGG